MDAGPASPTGATEVSAFVAPDAYVYRIPPATTVGHRAETWNVNSWIQEVRVRVACKDEEAAIRLEDPGSGGPWGLLRSTQARVGNGAWCVPGSAHLMGGMSIPDLRCCCCSELEGGRSAGVGLRHPPWQWHPACPARPPLPPPSPQAPCLPSAPFLPTSPSSRCVSRVPLAACMLHGNASLWAQGTARETHGGSAARVPAGVLGPKPWRRVLCPSPWRRTLARTHCPTPHPQAVEPVIDSSRYYVLKIVDRDSGRHAFVGLGFRQREAASEFCAVLHDHIHYVHKKHAAEHAREEHERQLGRLSAGEGSGSQAELAGQAADLGLRQGENLTLKVPSDVSVGCRMDGWSARFARPMHGGLVRSPAARRGRGMREPRSWDFFSSRAGRAGSPRFLSPGRGRASTIPAPWTPTQLRRLSGGTRPGFVSGGRGRLAKSFSLLMDGEGNVVAGMSPKTPAQAEMALSPPSSVASADTATAWGLDTEGSQHMMPEASGCLAVHDEWGDYVS